MRRSGASGERHRQSRRQRPMRIGDSRNTASLLVRPWRGEAVDGTRPALEYDAESEADCGCYMDTDSESETEHVPSAEALARQEQVIKHPNEHASKTEELYGRWYRQEEKDKRGIHDERYMQVLHQEVV